MRTAFFTFVAVFAAFLSGCKTSDIEVVPTKTWEGHFKTQQEARAAIESAELEKGESIWILTNRTLSRVLKNTEKR